MSEIQLPDWVPFIGALDTLLLILVGAITMIRWAVRPAYRFVATRVKALVAARKARSTASGSAVTLKSTQDAVRSDVRQHAKVITVCRPEEPTVLTGVNVTYDKFRYQVRFRKPVRPGKTAHLQAEVDRALEYVADVLYATGNVRKPAMGLSAGFTPVYASLELTPEQFKAFQLWDEPVVPKPWAADKPVPEAEPMSKAEECRKAAQATVTVSQDPPIDESRDSVRRIEKPAVQDDLAKLAKRLDEAFPPKKGQ